MTGVIRTKLQKHGFSVPVRIQIEEGGILLTFGGFNPAFVGVAIREGGDLRIWDQSDEFQADSTDETPEKTLMRLDARE